MHTSLVELEAAYILSSMGSKGAQWLSGRVLDSRPKGRGFEPHRHHCVVVLEQVLVQTRKTRPYITEILLMGRKESNQTKSMSSLDNGETT